MNITSQRALSRFNAATAPEKVLGLPYARAGLGLLHYKTSSRSRYVTVGGHGCMAAVISISTGATFKDSSRISFAPESTLNVNTTDYLNNIGSSGGT